MAVRLGLIGAGIELAVGLTSLFGTDIGFVQIVIAVQEMVMAVWLIAKGFNPGAIVSDGDRPPAGRAMAGNR